MDTKIQSKNGYKIINLNRRIAIRERCLNCSGWSYKEVQICQFSDCQLHPYRMRIGKQDAKARNKAIRQYCLWCCADKSSEVAKCPAIDIRAQSQEDAAKKYNILQSNRKEIDETFGESLEWDFKENRKQNYIKSCVTIGGLKDKDKWPEIQNEMIDRMIKLEKIMKSYIDTLP